MSLQKYLAIHIQYSIVFYTTINTEQNSYSVLQIIYIQ